MATKQDDKWKVWSQHWVGYKPRVFGTYSSREEAYTAADKLNASPSGEWYIYSVEAPSSAPGEK